MSGYQYRETFDSPYTYCGYTPDGLFLLCQKMVGRPFTVKRVIDTPDETVDECVLPMFEIEIDGITFDAWPEEVLVN